ncbi:hypothetical protein V8E54_006561 [Elaphomyces granulatus]
MAETQTGKEANIMVGRQPFPSYAASGKFLLHSRPLLTCISQSAQSLHGPFLQNGFFEITALTESHSARQEPNGITGPEVKASDLALTFSMPTPICLQLRTLSSFRSLPNRHHSCSPCIANLDDRNYCSYGITSAGHKEPNVITGFFEITARNHFPLDMVGIKAIITQQGAERDNRLLLFYANLSSYSPITPAPPTLLS